MFKKVIAFISLGYGLLIWHFALSSASPKNDDWAPVATIMYGILGGIVQVIASLAITLISWKLRRSPGSQPAGFRIQILYYNVGWMLTAMAILTLMIIR
jgi:hypothetical protein